MNIPDRDPTAAKDKLHDRYAEMEKAVLGVLNELSGSGMAHPRWVAIARTHFEEGFMAMHRSLRDYPGDDPNNYSKMPAPT